MSNTRFLLLVLLIPLLGLPLVGIDMGTVEILGWVALLVAWVVAFVKASHLRPRVPLIALGVVIALGAGVAAFNHATVDGSNATVEQEAASG